MAPRASQPGLFTAAPLPVAVLGDAERLACLRLIRSENVGPSTFRELVNYCGGAEKALAALPELSRRGGRRRAVRICPRDVAEAELEAAQACGAKPLFTIEPGFPAALAHVAVPPPMLYVKGRVELLAGPAVAIVGSRNASAAGQTFARQLAKGLGEAGMVVVSGLARGVDGAAHAVALTTGTIAVVAGGVDHIYPPEHAELQQRIGVEGCLVSEQPPGFRPRGQDFPRRNRIIAGISMGVVIVEAARRSGSLITARQATEMGREVFAVPGHPLDPRAEGTNDLLKKGATIATCAADVVEALAPQLAERGDIAKVMMEAAHEHLASSEAGAVLDLPTGDVQAAVLAALGPAPAMIDEIARATGLAVRHVKIAVLELALADRIERHGSQLVSLRVPA